MRPDVLPTLMSDFFARRVLHFSPQDSTGDVSFGVPRPGTPVDSRLGEEIPWRPFFSYPAVRTKMAPCVTPLLFSVLFCRSACNIFSVIEYVNDFYMFPSIRFWQASSLLKLVVFFFSPRVFCIPFGPSFCLPRARCIRCMSPSPFFFRLVMAGCPGNV